MKLHTTADGKVVIGSPIKNLPQIKYDGSRRLPDIIGGFLDYTDILDVPVNFLRWSALSTVCGAAQRKISMNMAHFDVSSNMYVVLVGPPGTKKSTAIRAGKKLLRRVPGINLTSDAPSIPGIMEDFKEIPQKDHQSLNAFILELSTLYENAKESMTEFLTHMYDGDADYIKRTRVGGKETIPFPWLNLIAGTTPSYMGRNIGDNELEGGLEARKINVFSDKRILKSSRPKMTPRHTKLQEDLIHDLARISTLTGEFDFHEGEEGAAFAWYDSWYLNEYKTAAEIEKELFGRDLTKVPAESRFPRISDHRTAGYYERKHIHVLKVAMAVALSRKDTLVITLEELLIAKALLEAVEPDMVRVYSSVGGNTYMTDIERIATQLKAAGEEGLLYSEILAANIHALERRFLDDALKCLESMGDATKRLDQSVKPMENRYFAL